MIRSFYLLTTPAGDEIAYIKAENDRVLFGCDRAGTLYVDGTPITFYPPKAVLQALPQRFALFVPAVGAYALWGEKAPAEKLVSTLRPAVQEKEEAKPLSAGQPPEPLREDVPAPEEVLLSPDPDKQTYWDCNAAEFLSLLQNNPADDDMAELIPQSRWVHVEREGTDTLFGVIFDEDDSPLYLCYGFDRPWRETPPEDLDGYCQWIPQDCRTPHGKGYWVIYVNAATGERIK